MPELCSARLATLGTLTTLLIPPVAADFFPPPPGPYPGSPAVYDARTLSGGQPPRQSVAPAATGPVTGGPDRRSMAPAAGGSPDRRDYATGWFGAPPDGEPRSAPTFRDPSPVDEPAPASAAARSTPEAAPPPVFRPLRQSPDK